MHKNLKTSSDSEFFQEANDAIGFLKSHCKMEVQTVTVFELAIAGKLRAVLFLRPFFTALQKLSCITVMPVGFQNENPFQVTDQRGLGPFHIISPQLTLCKSNGGFPHIFDKTDRILRFCQLFKFLLKTA